MPEQAEKNRAAQSSHRPSGLIAYLAVTAAVSGALVMIIEVVGSRVIGPFFGVSLFVWTSLISVTLVSLGLGYAAGGLLADRKASPDVLYGLLALAGVAVLLVPFLKAPVLRSTLPLGLRSGALLGSLLLFGPGLFLLGCVPPFVIKVAATELRRIGRTVGLFSALSTLGSFTGTLATGYLLIGHLAVSRIFLVVGAALLALAAAYFAFFRRAPLALALLLLPALAARPEGLTSKVMANGTRVTEVARHEGFYGTVQVVEYSYGAARTRELVLDGLVQGGVDVASGLSIYEYAYFLEQLPYGMNNGGRSCLVIGLGAGLVPAWYGARGVRTDVVDINPDVVRVARDHFGFRPTGEVVLADARFFLTQPGRRYDYVILDVFTGDTTPSHLLSREALSLVRSRLEDGGLLAVNLAGTFGSRSFMTASVVRTFEQVFPSVQVYPLFPPEDPDAFGNMVLVARNGPPLAFDPSKVSGFPVHAMARPVVERFLGRPYRLPPGRRAMVLTDDFNPIDVADNWLKERVRAEILRATDWDILL
jgi:spermidine synthase